jgi:chemotaxis protein CheD
VTSSGGLARPAERRLAVIQGEAQVSADPDLVLTTVLGSCVAACLHDPAARVGGMNHFLLPEACEVGRAGEAERYGVHLMELLVNGLLKAGARRSRLEARLFGGCASFGARFSVGARNAEFAAEFLRAEGIAHVGGSLGGSRGRRVEFRPASGRARQMLLSAAPPPPPRPTLPPPSAGGDIELF